MKTPRTVLVALVAGAALAACAAPGADPTSPGSTGAAPMTSTPDPNVPPTPAPTPSPGGPSKPPPGTAATLTGMVQAGVEPNCFLLDGNLLVGAPRGALKAGTRVTVTGHSQPDLMTTCQQGTPFVVESVRPA